MGIARADPVGLRPVHAVRGAPIVLSFIGPVATFVISIRLATASLK